jgi:hypothetical protein
MWQSFLERSDLLVIQYSVKCSVDNLFLILDSSDQQPSWMDDTSEIHLIANLIPQRMPPIPVTALAPIMSDSQRTDQFVELGRSSHNMGTMFL